MKTKEQLIKASGLILFMLPLLLYTTAYAGQYDVADKKATAIACSPVNNKEENPVEEKNAPGCAHAGITALLNGRRECDDCDE
jgi:hypothetical protein